MTPIPCKSRTAINFPMLCVMRHYEGPAIAELNQSLAELVRKMEADNRATQRATNVQGGYHTDTNFINRDDPVIKKLREEVLYPGIQEYIGQYYQLRFIDPANRSPKVKMKGWANIMRKGEWNGPHDHTGEKNRISAVYYAQLPTCQRPEGSLQFENPNQISVQHGEYGNVIFHPSEGDLVLFPCYQRHFSHPFYTEGERVLVASDIIIVDDEFNNTYNNFMSLSIQSPRS